MLRKICGYPCNRMYCPWFILRNKSNKSLVFDSFDHLKINKENRNQILYTTITVPWILLVLSCVYTIIIIMLMYFQTIRGQLSNSTQMMIYSFSSMSVKPIATFRITITLLSNILSPFLFF